MTTPDTSKLFADAVLEHLGQPNTATEETESGRSGPVPDRSQGASGAPAKRTTAAAFAEHLDRRFHRRNI